MVELKRDTLVGRGLDDTLLVKVRTGHIEIGLLRTARITETVVLRRGELP